VEDVMLRKMRRRYPRHEGSRLAQTIAPPIIVEEPIELPETDEQLPETETENADQVQGAAERSGDQGRGDDAIEEDEAISAE
jgi:hypothetical protein